MISQGACDFSGEVQLDQFPVPPGCAYAVAAVSVPRHIVQIEVMSGQFQEQPGMYRDRTVAKEGECLPCRANPINKHFADPSILNLPMDFGPADYAWFVAFAGNGTSKIVRYHSHGNVSLQGARSRLLPGLAGGHLDETDSRVPSFP